MESKSTVLGRLKGTERTMGEARAALLHEWHIRNLWEMRYHAGRVSRAAYEAANERWDRMLRNWLSGYGREGKAALRALDAPRKPIPLLPGKWGVNPGQMSYYYVGSDSVADRYARGRVCR